MKRRLSFYQSNLLHLLLVVASFGWISAIAAAADFTFAVIGDTPYTEQERTQFVAMAQAIGQRDVAFAIHVGDIKSGDSPCDDATFYDRHTLFARFPLPLIFVPGDNEWTDCHRPSAGGYDPLERLAKLREIFFAKPESLGERPIALTHQRASAEHPAMPENVRWQHGNVLFVTLNITGSNNGIGNENQPSKAYLMRERANRRWLAEAFSLAEQQKLAAVVIAIQANPDFEADARGKPKVAYRDFLQQLRTLTANFEGEVLLLHGDSHRQRIDKPLLDPRTGKPLKNFTRVETFGSPLMGWIEVTARSTPTFAFEFAVHPWPPQIPPTDRP